MSTQFDFPDGTPLVGDDKRPTMPWSQAFTRWHRVILSLMQSGPTTQRPTSVLWIGRQYFDTTLNKPVWVSAVTPAVVWRTADGVVA